MTKIAHLDRKREQDSAVADRNDEKLTRVARATAKAGADVARESVQLAQNATEVLAQSATDVAEDVYGTPRQLAGESPEFGRAFAELMGEQIPPERGHAQRLRSGRELDGCRPGSEQAYCR